MTLLKKLFSFMDQRAFHPLHDTDTLEQALALSHEKPIVLFKHSMTCGISSRARQRMHELAEETDPDVYELVVQRSRPLSQEIAQRFEIRHESPQAIVVYKAKPIFHTSHGGISATSLRNALQAAQEDTPS